MMKRFYVVLKCCFAVMAMAWFTGCVSSVRTTVSTFRADSPHPTAGTVRILPVPGSDAKVDILEFGFFSQKLAAKLIEQGYRVVKAPEADYIAYLEYDTLRQKKNRSHSNLSGSLGYRYGYGAVVIADGYDKEQFEFVRRVKVTLERGQSEPNGEKILSLSAVSYGQCEHLVSVFDQMLVAIFDNMRNKNGSVITTSVKGSRPCAD